MKLLKTLTPFVVLGMALCVTVGSVYITVQAAAQQDAAEAPEAVTGEAASNPFEAAEAAPPAAEVIPAPADAVVVPEAEVVVADTAVIADEVSLVAPVAIPAEERTHVVFLDSSGSFTGTLSTYADNDGNVKAVGGIKVQLIRQGEVIGDAETNEDGSFSVSGLTPGSAALLALGPDGFLLFGLRLAATPATAVGGPVALQMDSAVVSGRNIDAVMALMFGEYGINAFRFDTGPGVRGTEGFPIADGPKSTLLRHHPIRLQPNGSLVGRVLLIDPVTGALKPVDDLTLHFLRDGVEVATSVVGVDGTFSALNLTSGVYAVASTGADGVTAMSVHVLDAPATAALERQGYKLTAIDEVLDLTVVPVQTTNTLVEPGDGEVTPPPVVPPMAGGFPGGGAMGGGGAGGGGGGFGLGALAAGAAGAVAGYLAADDDDAASPGD